MDKSMPQASQQTCETKVDGVWRSASLAEAHSIYSFSPKRCPTCHGQVYVTGVYAIGAKLAFQHRRAHDGCPHVPARFRGTASPHPKPVA